MSETLGVSDVARRAQCANATVRGVRFSAMVWALGLSVVLRLVYDLLAAARHGELVWTVRAELVETPVYAAVVYMCLRAFWHSGHAGHPGMRYWLESLAVIAIAAFVVRLVGQTVVHFLWPWPG